MFIPIFDVESLNDYRKLSHFCEVGIAYFKIEGFDIIQGAINNLLDFGTEFFNRDSNYKLKWALNEEIEGYINRMESSAPQTVQQFYFRPEKPIGPFIEKFNQIKVVSDAVESIGFSLFKALFHHVGLSNKHADDIIQSGPRKSLSLSYYPKKTVDSNIVDMHAHKDFGLVTIIYNLTAGLEVYIDGMWHSLPPKPGYAIINVGNALELMLGKRCHSPLHRVLKLRNLERISLVYFIEPNLKSAIVDYTTQELLFDSYAQYFDYLFKTSHKSEEYIEPTKAIINNLWEKV